MKSENYTVIQGWMCNELNLKGNELLIFALIYGYSQDGVSQLQGGRQYIADTFNISLPTVDKALKGLLDKNYIERDVITLKDGYQANYYNVNLDYVKKLYTGTQGVCKETLGRVHKETLLSNIQDSNNKTIPKGIVSDFEFGSKKTKHKKLSLWDTCISLINEFTDDEILRSLLESALKQFLENSKESGTPFYTNNFKGKLNTLKKLSTDNYVQREVVKQTLDNGWNNFYDLKTTIKNNISTDIGYTSERANKKGVNNGRKKY